MIRSPQDESQISLAKLEVLDSIYFVFEIEVVSFKTSQFSS